MRTHREAHRATQVKTRGETRPECSGSARRRFEESFRKIGSVLLSFVFVMGMIPTSALAAEDTAAAEGASGAAIAAGDGATSAASDADVASADATTADALAVTADTGEATYDEDWGRWATSKGVTGTKTSGDYGYVEGAETPAQIYFTIDESTKEITVNASDAGTTAIEVPVTIDGNPVVSVGGTGGEQLASLSFATGSKVRELDYGLTRESQVAHVDIPNSVSTIGSSTFENSDKLQTVSWPENGEFVKLGDEAFSGCDMLDDSVVETLPATVKTIGMRAFMNCGSPNIYVEGETQILFTDVVVPGTVETVENDAFRSCDRLRSVTIGEGVKFIGAHAFSGCTRLAGTEIVLPKSLTSLGHSVFDNDTSVSSGGQTTFLHNAVTLRFMNPDFPFTVCNSLYVNTVTIDGTEYYDPFTHGQTIIAFAKNSAGEESMLKKYADLKADEKDEYDETKPAYTFEWMKDAVAVTGTVPADATVVITQSDETTQASVGEDGSFSQQCLSGIGATVRISLEGYYDQVLTRPAADMTGAWDLGVIALDSFEKLPASRVMTADVQKQTGVDDDGNSVYSPVLTDDSLSFELKQGSRVLVEDQDYTRQGFVFALAEGEGAPTQTDELTLTVVPESSLKLGQASATGTLDGGAFDVALPQWGTATVQVKSDFAGNSRVLVFSGNVLVDSGLTSVVDYEDDFTTPIRKYRTAQLTAGTYTVVALNQTSVDFTAGSLTAFEALGLQEGNHYAKTTVTVLDGKNAEVSLDVPVFDVAAYAKERGVNSMGIVASDRRVTVGCETVVRVSYSFDGTRNATVNIVLPESEVADFSVGYKNEKGSGQMLYDRQGDTVSVSVADSAKGEIQFAFKPTQAKEYTVSAYLTQNRESIPMGSARFNAIAASISLGSSEITTLENNAAIVNATPGTNVELVVGGSKGKVYTGTANQLGRASIHFDLPENTLSGERVQLDARLAGSTEVWDTAYVTYMPGAFIKSFKVTTSGRTQTVIQNGAETNKKMILLHHNPDKGNAYWTFDMVIDSQGQDVEDFADSFEMGVLCYDDNMVSVPMVKKSYDSGGVRYVGEYVDEAYLAILDDYTESGAQGPVELGNFEGLFLPTSYLISNALFSTLVNVDAQTAVQKADEQVQERINDFNNVIADYTAANNLDNGADAAELDAEYDEFIDWIGEMLAEDSEIGADKAQEVVSQMKEEVGSCVGLLSPSGDSARITIDDMIFDGAYSLDEDWFIDICSGYAIDAPSEVADVAKQLGVTFSKADTEIRNAKKAIGDNLGVGDLSQYGSWDDVLGASLQQKTGGDVSVSALEDDPPASFQPLTGDSTWQPKDEDAYEGFQVAVYTSGALNRSFVNVDFSQQAVDGWQGVAGNYALGNLAGNLDMSFMELMRTPAGRACLKYIAGSNQRLASFNNAIRYAKSTQVLGGRLGAVSYWNAGGKATSGLIGAAASAYGVNASIKSYEETLVMVEELEGEVENLQMWIDRYAAKNPKTDSDIRCLLAYQREKTLAEEYLRLLKVQLNHNTTDVVVGSTVTVVGTAATVASAGTAAGITNGVGVGYDVASAAIYSKRAPKIQRALDAYRMATAWRIQACKDDISINERYRDSSIEEILEAARRGELPWDMAINIVSAWLGYDPSGFVYEAVTGNKLEGVTATVWRSDSADGTDAVQWNAEEWEQVNPQVTGSDGVFSWFTPTGYYQVRFEKEGYEPTQTEWLPVLPIQTDHEISMVSTEAPTVTGAYAYTDGVVLEFSQYMDTEAALQVAGGGLENATLEWMNVEESPDGKPLSKTLFVKTAGEGVSEPVSEFALGFTVSLALSGAKNYVGIELGAWQSGDLTVGVRPAELKLNAEQAITLQLGDTGEVVAYVKDKDGNPLAGATVDAALASGTFATIAGGIPMGDAAGTMRATTDENGTATFVLDSELPGLTQLTVAVPGSGLSKSVDVRVATEQVRPARPTATLGSYTFDARSPKENYATVPVGTQLVINADEGVTIYYTTNGNCPCKEDGGRVEYTGPVTVTENTRFRIAAYKDGMPYDDYSERLNITVTVTPRDPDDIWQRLYGDSRYETMSAVVSSAFPDGSCDTVVVATGENFPDALSASGIAGLAEAPVILTETGSLSPEAASEITRLGATYAYVVGGEAAVSSDVVASLANMGLIVQRCYGDTRQATATAVFHAVPRGWGDTAVVASGYSFADALSVSSYSCAARAPIFLTEADGMLSDQTLGAIADGGFSRVIVVGGTAVVSGSVESQLSELSASIETERLAGNTRYETSLKIAEFAIGEGLTANGMAIATGRNFPDALAAGAACGKTSSVILLVADEDASYAAIDTFFAKHKGEVYRGFAAGGNGVVSDALFDYVKRASV